MKAKPFIKWVGGDIFFYMLQQNISIKTGAINDNFFDILHERYQRMRIYEQNSTPNIVCRNY